MDVKQVVKYLKYLRFSEVLLHKGVSIYTSGKYQIMFSDNQYRVRNMYMYYDSVELYKVPVSYISTEDIMYTLVNVFELGVENMNNKKDKITNSKCIEKLKKYEQSKNSITLNTSDRTSFVVNDKNVLFLLDDDILVHTIKRDNRVNQILNDYHFEDNLLEFDYDKYGNSNKFIQLKALLDERIKEERIKKNVLYQLCTELGFRAYKNNTIFKYTDDIRISIKEKCVELYYFGYKQSFDIDGYILTNIINTIFAVEAQRK